MACVAGYPIQTNPTTLRVVKMFLINLIHVVPGIQTRQHTTADAMANTAAAIAAAQAAANPVHAPSQRVQSVTATIDYNSLATAMSRLNEDSANKLEEGTQPRWGLQK